MDHVIKSAAFKPYGRGNAVYNSFNYKMPIYIQYGYYMHSKGFKTINQYDILSVDGLAMIHDGKYTYLLTNDLKTKVKIGVYNENFSNL